MRSVNIFDVDLGADVREIARVMEAVHVIRCPECQLELCSDPSCRKHSTDVWVAVHAEFHPLAAKALMLYGEIRSSE